MNLSNEDYLSFFNLGELFTKLGYINTLSEVEKNLLNLAWQIIIPDESGNQDVGAS